MKNTFERTFLFSYLTISMLSGRADLNKLAERKADCKEWEEEILFSLTGIISVKEYNLELTLTDQYEGSHTYEALEEIDQYELRPAGYEPAILDIQSDR